MKKKRKNISGQILNKWILICERRNHTYFSHRMEKELSSLNPGVNREKVIRNYYLEKIRISLTVFGGSGIIVLLCICNVVMNGDLEREHFIKKESMGGGTKTVVLDAEIGDEMIKDVVIEIDEKELSDDEIRKQLETVKQELAEKILGKNESLQYVVYPLNLINTWEDTGISIFWTSSNYRILQEDGIIGMEKIPEEGIEVTLTALLTYNHLQAEEKVTVRVFPEEKTEKEKLEEELLSLVDQQKTNTKTEEFLELPQNLNNTEIKWKDRNGDIVITLLGLMFITFFAVLWGKDKEVHKKYEERNRQLLLEYSEFVSKLQLLVSSGMSIRNAFIRLGREYHDRRERGGSRKYVYEELLVVVRKMENGMNEIDAYDYFGKRCDLICYKKLAAIIMQNVKKGTDGLKISLLAETKNAFEERKQTARKMGEEAGTKLLLPMMMMMGIVLMIIVIPAYFSFGGI